MKYNYKRLAVAGIFAFGLAAGLAACGSDDDDDSSGTDSSGADTDLSDTGANPAGTSSPAPGTTPAELVSAFDGTWVSNCTQELSVTGFSEYQRITLVADADLLTRTVNSYTDTDCSVAAVPAVAISENSMQFPEGEVTTTQGPAAFVDITQESIEVDGFDASALQQTIGFDVEYNIYVVGVDGRLYFGVPALSAETRPDVLNTDVYFEAQ